ncbi:MAG TPA: hypothetical protein VL356_09860 [Acidocella sp.]|nr:hypothetical protein [Acidocella sp.]
MNKKKQKNFIDAGPRALALPTPLAAFDRKSGRFPLSEHRAQS